MLGNIFHPKNPYSKHGTVQCFNALLIAAAAAWQLGCDENIFVPPPPPKVTVDTPTVVDSYTLYTDYIGYTKASESVELRARVRGFLDDIHYEEGKKVEANAPLFTIKPEEFEVALKAATGTYDDAVAAIKIAEIEAQRQKELFAKRATSEIEYERSKAQVESAIAKKLQAQAMVDSAKLDLSFTKVNSPIAGYVTRANVDRGNLVG